VPRNRRDQSTEVKREQILAAASLLFLDEGYEGASMPKIAAAAGVTPNTLYWYFGDKDQLFVRVADEYLKTLLTQHAVVSAQPLGEQFVWLVDSLRPVRHLVAAVHARVAKSPVIAQWHAAFHGQMEALFEQQLGVQLTGLRREAEAAAVTFAIEGAIVHDLSADAVANLCESLATRVQAL
jgi:AcrR family transcriptional regulator